ncbi:MAG: phosphopantetheine-binding protein [Gemmatimonadota bacterium]|nr:phosphopantetheine-binding protein [Gemmatimonadota bacterium]
MGLDSLNSINLLLDLEATFGISFPDEMLTPEILRTARKITDALNKLTPN